MTTDQVRFFDSLSHVEQYQQTLKDFIAETMGKLTEDQRQALELEATDIVKHMKKQNARINLTLEAVLEMFISALYYQKFGESPTQTAARANMK